MVMVNVRLRMIKNGDLMVMVIDWFGMVVNGIGK